MDPRHVQYSLSSPEENKAGICASLEGGKQVPDMSAAPDKKQQQRQLDNDASNAVHICLRPPPPPVAEEEEQEKYRVRRVYLECKQLAKKEQAGSMQTKMMRRK